MSLEEIWNSGEKQIYFKTYKAATSKIDWWWLFVLFPSSLFHNYIQCNLYKLRAGTENANWKWWQDITN